MIWNPAGSTMFKVNNRNDRTRCEICSKSFGVFIVNFEQVNANWEATFKHQINCKGLKNQG